MNTMNRVEKKCPVGYDLFEDSESFLDELSYGWEIDVEKAEIVSIVSNYSVGLPSITTHIPTKSELRSHSFALE